MNRNLSIVLFIVMLFSTAGLYAQNRKVTVFALDGKALERNKSAIQNNDPGIMPAYKLLVKDADKSLQFEPVSVMEKTNIPPSGDKHDYMSLAPYHWPDSTKPGGIPYIRKDGQTNPEVKNYKDKEYLPKLCGHIETLALAYFFSENNAYAEHATKLIRVWFLDPATKMNPNLKYAQAIKGVNEGRGAGLIDSRHFVRVIDAIGLLNRSKSWKDTDQQGMKKWFCEFLNWMQTSKIGIDELNAKNNHGAWYDAQRLSMALFIDSMDLAKRIINHAAGRLDYQVDDKGFFPAEMERTISLHYSAFVMNAFFTIAQMSDEAGVDLWNHKTPSGKSLKTSFVALKPYFSNEQNWEGQQIKDYAYDDGFMLLREATKQYNCKDCEEAVKRLAADKAPRLRSNLLY